MIRFGHLSLIVLMIAVLLAPPRRSLAAEPVAHAAPSPEKIREAVDKGVAALYAAQNEQGHWDSLTPPKPDERSGQSPNDGNYGGSTALCLYALLAAGESPADPKLTKAIEFLKNDDTRGVYALGLRCLVWDRMPQTDDVKKVLAADVRKLVLGIIQKGSRGYANAAGHYGYDVNATVTRQANEALSYSHSRSQYGLLGVWAGARNGVEIPTGYWQLAEAGWKRNQRPDGGWGYMHLADNRPLDTTAGMTAAGVASLFITQDMIGDDASIKCRGNGTNPNIESGVKWLAENFDKQLATDRVYDRDYPLISLYAVERVGVASGLRYFGEVDWYARGAAWMLSKQSSKGTWGGSFGGDVNTAFAVLFLSRGLSPVMINKLKYNTLDRRGEMSEAAWNQRPRDVANAVDWASREAERELHWQIVTEASPVEEWLDAPILYISGSDDLRITPELEAKLKDYIERGGMLLLNADCGRRNFGNSARALGERLFPQYKWQSLSADHPINTRQQFQVSGRDQLDAMALSNGVRELMILVDSDDAGRRMQLRNDPQEAAYKFFANLYLYATDKAKGQMKGQTHLVTADPAITPTETLKLARLKYQGNWNPEPAGWPRVAAVLRNQHKLDLQVSDVDLAADALDGYRVAHLTGTDELKLPDAAIAKLKAFVDGGGLLLIDAAGGNGAFAESSRELAGKLSSADAFAKPLPADHPLFKLAKFESSPVGYREVAQQTLLGDLNAPRLRAADVGGKLGVIYSAEDLSAGLVGQRVDGVVGYTPDSATTLVSAIIRYASEEK